MTVIQVHTLQIELNWNLVGLISTLDRFDASWRAVERREGQSLKQLKTIATVMSVGASTRIEGSSLSDDQVEIILRTLDIKKLEERDIQEVAGYYEVLELIADSYHDIPVTENAMKDLHQRLLTYSEKDVWHRGNYKQHSNRVEATFPDGHKQIIFETTQPGFETEDAMHSLVAWFQKDYITHPLVKCAVFTYEFLSIHPFQDGNGRLSRLMSTLLLLKAGYRWIEYISFEHEIEKRKREYYTTLRKCQAKRPGEDITAWVSFFFNALIHIQQLLSEKISSTGTESELSPKEKLILLLINENPGIQSGEIAHRLTMPNPTVKRILGEMVERKVIEREGVGRGSSYRGV